MRYTLSTGLTCLPQQVYNLRLPLTTNNAKTMSTHGHHKKVSIRLLFTYYGLSEDSYGRCVSESHMGHLSSSMHSKWRLVAPQLRLKDVVPSIEGTSEARSEEEKAKLLLILWRRRRGNEATYKSLIEALLKADCRSDAEYVCQMLKKSVGGHSHSAVCLL